MTKYRLIGIVFIFLSIIIAKYGDKKVNQQDGGVILRLFSHPKQSVKILKWVLVFFLLWFGLWLLVTNGN